MSEFKPCRKQEATSISFLRRRGNTLLIALREEASSSIPVASTVSLMTGRHVKSVW